MKPQAETGDESWRDVLEIARRKGWTTRTWYLAGRSHYHFAGPTATMRFLKVLDERHDYILTPNHAEVTKHFPFTELQLDGIRAAWNDG